MPTKAKRGAQAAPTTKRAALYPRVSSKGQEEDGTSFQTQEQRCRQYAAERGYTVDDEHVFAETWTGAELWERPRLTALREAMRRGEIDVVVAYAVDRVSRNQAHLAIVVDELERHGARLELVTEDFEQSAVGAFIRNAKAFAAELELEKIKERTTRGKRARAEAGRLIPGPRPRYGYEWSEDRTRLVVNESTAPVVRRLYAEALKGQSLRAMAAALTRDGIPRPTGPNKDGEHASRWADRSVWLILTDSAYAGDASAWRHSKSGTTVSLPAGIIPPLVSRATFEAVQVRMKANKAAAIRNNRHPEDTLLRGGYVRCGYCGTGMQGHRYTHRGRLAIIYRCPHGMRTKTCQHNVAAGILDTAVWSHVERLLTRPHLIAAELERMRGEDPSAADLEAIERQLTQVVRQQRNLIENLANVNGAAGAVIAEKINSLEQQRAQLTKERKDIFGRSAAWRQAQDRSGDLETWCAAMAKSLGTLTYHIPGEAVSPGRTRRAGEGMAHRPRATL